MPTLNDLRAQSDDLRAQYEELLRLRAELDRLVDRFGFLRCATRVAQANLAALIVEFEALQHRSAPNGQRARCTDQATRRKPQWLTHQALPETLALDDRIFKSHGVRETGWISSSGCQPNRVQFTCGKTRMVPTLAKCPAEAGLFVPITKSGVRTNHSFLSARGLSRSRNVLGAFLEVGPVCPR